MQHWELTGIPNCCKHDFPIFTLKWKRNQPLKYTAQRLLAWMWSPHHLAQPLSQGCCSSPRPCMVLPDLKVLSRDTGSVSQHKPRARSCAATLQVNPASWFSWKLNMWFDGFFFFLKQSQVIAAAIPHICPVFFSRLPLTMPYIPAPLLEAAPLGFQPESVRKLPENYFYKSSGQPSARQASLNGIHLTQQHKSVSVLRKGEEQVACWRRQWWQARPAALKFA